MGSPARFHPEIAVYAPYQAAERRRRLEMGLSGAQDENSLEHERLLRRKKVLQLWLKPPESALHRAFSVRVSTMVTLCKQSTGSIVPITMAKRAVEL
jgi:hypothetical protein